MVFYLFLTWLVIFLREKMSNSSLRFTNCQYVALVNSLLLWASFFRNESIAGGDLPFPSVSWDLLTVTQMSTRRVGTGTQVFCGQKGAAFLIIPTKSVENYSFKTEL